MITSKIKSFLKSCNLGYVATVSPDRLPNISPKGTIIAWDEQTIVFADIRSPDTVKNLQSNPNIEINVIDPLSRKGYLFKGKSKILKDGKQFDKILSYYKENNIQSTINAIIVVTVSKVSKVTSPLYDLGYDEDEIQKRYTL